MSDIILQVFPEMWLCQPDPAYLNFTFPEYVEINQNSAQHIQAVSS